jgi:hypothetical protein
VQILRIMKDSRIGTYALVGMLLVLHMKLHALAAFEASTVGAVLVAAHCASRWTSVPLLYCCKYIQVRPTLGTGLLLLLLLSVSSACSDVWRQTTAHTSCTRDLPVARRTKKTQRRVCTIGELC